MFGERRKFVMEKKKSRDLDFNDYFTILHLEYLSYYTRYSLYTRDIDKKKFKDICIGKREKINSIALKNSVPCMFGSEEMKRFYIDKFLNKQGIPNFHYRDSYQEKVKGHWDRVYWFFKGVEVEVMVNIDTYQRGLANYLDYNTDMLSVMCEGERGKYIIKEHISGVRRVLPEDFFDNLL